MRDLLYKDLSLAINPWFFILPVFTGALMLIPGWLYFIVLLYFCFIMVPNVLGGFKAQNDLMFSIMMPVRKKDIVGSKIIAFMTYELIHVMIALVYALINFKIYPDFPMIFLKPNVAFFGLVFVMFGLVNITLFPLYYKTGYNYGLAAIITNVVAVAFAGAVEVLVLKVDGLYMFMHLVPPTTVLSHWLLLIVGIIFFLLASWIAYMISIKRFEKVDL